MRFRIQPRRGSNLRQWGISLICPTAGKSLPNGYLYHRYLGGLGLGEAPDPTTMMATVDGIASVTVPSCVQLCPSKPAKPVKVLPERLRRSQVLG